MPAPEPQLLYPFVIMGIAMFFAIINGALAMRNWERRRGLAKVHIGLAVLCLVFVFAPVVHIMIKAPGMLEWNPDGRPLRP